MNVISMGVIMGETFIGLSDWLFGGFIKVLILRVISETFFQVFRIIIKRKNHDRKKQLLFLLGN
jgi:hypothetical protein